MGRLIPGETFKFRGLFSVTGGFSSALWAVHRIRASSQAVHRGQSSGPALFIHPYPWRKRPFLNLNKGAVWVSQWTTTDPGQGQVPTAWAVIC